MRGATMKKLLRSETGPWLWVAAAVVLLAVVAIVVRTIDANYTTDLLAPGGSLWDFRDAGYFSVRATLDGIVPYDIERYFAEYPVAQEFPLLPPTYLLIHAPFQLLGLTAASVAVVVINLVAAIAFAWWCLRLSRYRHTPAVVILVAAAVLISNGGRNVVYSGQATFLFVAGVYLAITASRESWGAVGIFVALIKPGFGLPLVLLVAALGRHRRALVGAAAAAAISAVMMIPFTIWAGGIGALWQILTDNLAYSADSPWISLATTTARVDAPAMIAALFDVVPSGAVELLIGFAVLATTSAALFLRRNRLSEPRVLDAAVVLICTAMLTATYHSFYDLPLLVLPLLLVARRDFADGQTALPERWLLIGTLLLASFNPFRVDMIQEGLAGYPRLVEILGTGMTGAAIFLAFTLALRLVWRLPAQDSIQKRSSSADVFEGDSITNGARTRHHAIGRFAKHPGPAERSSR